ncbi:MAG TPA: molybdopterin converting factor subunit 1 [Terriglobia bacterium]|nr:molybdopterin converting factor subunit 1 [Terriglobia bacterium]
MQVRLLFFATLKDIVGAREMQLDVPPGATVSDVLSHLETNYPRIKDYRGVALTAVNEEYVDKTASVKDGDELAIFPPVSGGGVQSETLSVARPGELYQITHEVIEAQKVARHLLRPEDGAICVFDGVVRNNSKGKRTLHLVYEAYDKMALKKMEEIGVFVREAWEIGCIAIVHRLGHLEIGETSVAVIVTSPHRRAAFDACHYAIDKLKKVVPIWKKEYFEDGEVWVEGGN